MALTLERRLTLDSAQLEAELVLLVDASHRSIAELTGSSDDPAAVARERVIAGLGK